MVLSSKPCKEVPPHGLLYVGQREFAVVSPEDGNVMVSFCFCLHFHSCYLSNYYAVRSSYIALMGYPREVIPGE